MRMHPECAVCLRFQTTRQCIERLKWIGFLNQLFYERRYIASAPSLSSTAELSKSCGPVGVLDGRVGGGAEIAGVRGGARVGRRRWLRITMITGSSSMTVLSLPKGRR